MSSKKSTDPPTASGFELPADLPAAFPENSSTRPLQNLSTHSSVAGLALQPPALVVDDPVPPRPAPGERPYRVLFADDSELFLKSIATSAASHLVNIAEVRTWAPSQGKLDAYLAEQAGAGWRPDLLVLDINMGAGGYNGLDYLQVLRDPVKAAGWAALPIVLATSSYKRDVDEGRLRDTGPMQGNGVPSSKNQTGIDPGQWYSRTVPAEPEAILYGKQGDLRFIVHVLEQLPLWKLAARRRAWNKLLAQVADLLDEPHPDPTLIGDLVARYSQQELAVSDVFVRWRDVGALFRLIGVRSHPAYEAIGSTLDPATIPLLAPLVAGHREPLIDNEGVSEKQAGKLAGRLSGKRMLAAAALLDGRTIGYMTLFRPSGGEPFDRFVDGEPLALLARLLASALGRAEALQRESERDREHLEFAKGLAEKKSEEDIALALARLVHTTINLRDDRRAEVTVRLVDYSTGAIERKTHVGVETPDIDLFMWDEDSAVQRVVKSGNSELISDTLKARPGRRVRLSQSPAGRLRSELCVALPSGGAAIGVVNLEHLLPEVYDEEDQLFVESAAALASVAIRQLRASQFLQRIARFAGEYGELKADDLRLQLMDLLISSCGASAVVRLNAPAQGQLVEPWSVSNDIEVRLHGGDPGKLRSHLESIYKDQWRETTIFVWIAEHKWNESDCTFTARSNIPVRLRGYNTGPRETPAGIEDAIAAMWLRAHPGEEPYACLLLLWFFTPGLTPEEVELLGSFARLVASLETRARETETWMRTAVVGEQAQAAGMLFQHIRHRLKGDLGALRGLAQRMDVAISGNPPMPVDGLVRKLHTQITQLSGRFNKSFAYIKQPEKVPFSLHVAHNEARASLGAAVGRIDLVDSTPLELQAIGDRDIYELAVFTLLDNSLEALEGQRDGRISVRAVARGDRIETIVTDNGPGLAESMRERLFQFGATTKANGLGSALAFARLRLQLSGGDLRYVPASEGQRSTGAEFVISQPAAGTKALGNDSH